MFRRFKLAWRIARFLPYEEKWEACWTKDDSQHLQSFSKTVTGARLLGILRNLVVTSAKDAAFSVTPVRACGIAAGVAYAVTTMEDLFPQVVAEAREPTVEEQAQEILDQTYGNHD